MSDLTDAFSEALDSATEARGSQEFVTFRGQQKVALVHDPEVDPDVIASGQTENLPTRVALRVEDVALPVVKLETIVVRGESLVVLSYVLRGGYVSMVVGDVTAEEE